ncbi:hypothetical protein SAMN04489712_112239 [Thermomonospora echinospora]|uniref:Uncharacterized protein n=1 Tax=Thermomonospora echinospora TaxID=1992 RepID=A0A1H6D452_9ACTN|nr:hypothetical protein [Thermomonospora echinospora]SEG79575.1 hypothetical protein SAMN04489712_112239 [Thermomonospora echinospora]
MRPPGGAPQAGHFRSRPPEQPDEPWRLPEPRRQGRRFPRKGLLLAVAGLAAAAVVAAGAVVLWPDGGTEPPPAAARTAGGIFTPDPAARVDGRNQQFTAAAARGGTVVVAGRDTDGTTGRVEFLVSQDAGRSFKAAGLSGTAPGRGEAIPRHLAGSVSGWAALGEDADGAVVAWSSRDGRSWTAQTPGDGMFEDGDRVLALVSHGSGYLAVGTTAARQDLRDGSPLAWLSPDGRSWRRLDSGELDMTRGDETLSLVEAAAHGSTLLVRGRWARDEKAASRNRLWRSDDGGRTWQESKVPNAPGTRGLRIGSGPAGLLAVRDTAKGGQARGVVFSSADGDEWAESGEFTFSKDLRVMRVAGAERGTTAVLAAGRRMQLVRSADGRSWQSAAEFTRPAGVLPAVTTAGDNLVLAGWTAQGGETDGMLLARDAGGREIQVARPAVRADQTVLALAATADRAVAVGGGNGDAAVWTSADGDAWQRGRLPAGPFGGPGVQRLSGVAGGGAGWVAIGTDSRLPRRPIVAVSRDGGQWTGGGGRLFVPSAKQTLRAYGVAAGPSGYVIVGEDGSSAVAWFSSDLRTWRRGTGEDKALDRTKDGNRWMQAVAAGSGGYVAVGGAKVTGGGNAPAAWTSRDGLTWTSHKMPVLPVGATGYLRHVAVSGTTAVAVGEYRVRGRASRMFAYLSADGGATWQEITPPGLSDAGSVSGVTATSQGFAVYGTVGASGAGDVALWTSRDGRTWQAERPKEPVLSGAGDQWLTGLVGFRDGVLAVGATTDGQGSQPLLWKRQPF